MSDGFDRGPVLGQLWTELDAAKTEIEHLRQRDERMRKALERISTHLEAGPHKIVPYGRHAEEMRDIALFTLRVVSDNK